MEGEVGFDEMRIRRWTELGVASELAAEVDAAYRELASAINLRRGVRSLLGELRRRRMRLVALTNGDSSVQRPKLERLLAHLDGGIVSGELGHHKPDVRAFRAALELVSGRPETAAMVGDNLEADIRGALEAGFARAVWMVRRPRPAPDRRVIPVTRLDQVVTALFLPTHG